MKNHWSHEKQAADNKQIGEKSGISDCIWLRWIWKSINVRAGTIHSAFSPAKIKEFMNLDGNQFSWWLLIFAFLSANRSFVRKWIRSLDECSKPDLVLYRADICLLFLIRLGLWMSCSVIDYYSSLSAFLFENVLCALIFYIPFNHPLTLIYFQKRSLIMKHWTVDSVFWMDLCFRIAFFCFAFLCRNPHRPESWLVCLSPDNICF